MMAQDILMPEKIKLVPLVMVHTITINCLPQPHLMYIVLETQACHQVLHRTSRRQKKWKDGYKTGL